MRRRNECFSDEYVKDLEGFESDYNNVNKAWSEFTQQITKTDCKG